MKNYAKIIRKMLQKTLKDFPTVIGLSWCLDLRKWNGTYDDGTPSGYWTQTAEKMQLYFEKSGHPSFRCTGALEKGQSRSKEGRKTTIHFTVCEENVQLLLGMVMSVNQLSLHGAVADMIQE